MQRVYKKSFLLNALSVLVASSLFPAMVLSQGTDAALLRGTVTDSSGGVVPGATVTMTNVATGVSESLRVDKMQPGAGRLPRDWGKQGSQCHRPLCLRMASSYPS